MTMSRFLTLMVEGWVATAVMIGICTLNESGALLRISRRLSYFLERLAPQSSASMERTD